MKKILLLIVLPILISGCCTVALNDSIDKNRTYPYSYYNAWEAVNSNEFNALCYNIDNQSPKGKQPESGCFVCAQGFIKLEKKEASLNNCSLIVVSVKRFEEKCRLVDDKFNKKNNGCEFQLELKEESKLKPIGYLSYLGLPFTIAIDVATFPIQFVVLSIGKAMVGY